MLSFHRAVPYLDVLWLLVWGVLSSVWCVTAAREVGGTFDEPVYLNCGLEHWRTGSCASLMKLGTMPLPVQHGDFAALCLEGWHGVRLDPQADWNTVLPWARSATLVFWWLLLVYAWLAARSLGGPWAGRLVVALLACEPSFLCHAALATTDIAITACLLALVYHFATGRDKPWLSRALVPAIWFGLALLAKASALVYGPVCLLVVGLEHLVRTQVAPAVAGQSLRAMAAETWRRLRPLRRDLTWVLMGGLALHDCLLRQRLEAGSDVGGVVSQLAAWLGTRQHGLAQRTPVHLQQRRRRPDAAGHTQHTRPWRFPGRLYRPSSPLVLFSEDADDQVDAFPAWRAGGWWRCCGREPWPIGRSWPRSRSWRCRRRSVCSSAFALCCRWWSWAWLAWPRRWCRPCATVRVPGGGGHW